MEGQKPEVVDADKVDMVAMEVADVVAKTRKLDGMDLFYPVKEWPPFIRKYLPRAEVSWAPVADHYQRFTVLNFLIGNGAPWQYVYEACVTQNAEKQAQWDKQLKDVWGQWRTSESWDGEQARQHAFYSMQHDRIVYVREGQWWLKLPGGMDARFQGLEP